MFFADSVKINYFLDCLEAIFLSESTFLDEVRIVTIFLKQLVKRIMNLHDYIHFKFLESQVRLGISVCMSIIIVREYSKSNIGGIQR